MSEETYGQLSQEELHRLRKLELVKDALDRLKRKGISMDIAICPVCKSPRVVQITSYFDLGGLGGFLPAYYCLDCGWYGRILTIMTNRPEDDAVLEDMQQSFDPSMEPDDQE